MNKEIMLKNLKCAFLNESGIDLDFRTHVYLENQYGLYPTYCYSVAEQIVPFVFEYLTDYLEKNQDEYPNFGGWEYNTSMSIEELRITKLKDFIERHIDDLLVHKK